MEFESGLEIYIKKFIFNQWFLEIPYKNHKRKKKKGIAKPQLFSNRGLHSKKIKIKIYWFATSAKPLSITLIFLIHAKSSKF